MAWLRYNFLFFGAFLLTLTLMFIQYKDTKATDFQQLTEMEKIAQLRRMNEYPPSAYRLANHIEKRPEAVIYFKLEKNFIDSFDLPTLFTEYFPPLVLLFFLPGYFAAIKAFPKQILVLTALPIALLTAIGHQSTHGPISLFGLIIGVSIYGMMIFIRRLSRRYEI